ncbi:hypothetical protein ES319_A12G080300v1 [Gossypium barbadense]|uniref:Protease Do-like PDZ domain-containing protein n=1 Tax=Gossypium barbadense TaxID=3634 RepID=A0A5J5TBU3_GOSBA|nr:hypothetical protein ES319_A12G080300v1 [Gossypium barbadense]
MLSCSIRSLRRLKCCCNKRWSSLILAKGYCFSKPKVVPSFCNTDIKFSRFYVWEQQSSLRQWRRRSLYTVTDTYEAIELALDSVVKIFTVSSSPNYFLPWQNKSQRETMGSGFVIPGKKILTNAHVVADHTFVLVRKHGSPTKYRAEVQAVGHECDLAILVVESPEFWEGMNFLELGDIPFLQEAVAVVGYPQGGDNISVTKGVVSRVEPTQYVHGATQLMAIQIDAAINPGNSGGPAIMGNKVAGVAFQNLSGAENIGYIIPVPVIKHFIAGIEESGKYMGFCFMGLSCQPTENVQLRNHFKMQPHMTVPFRNRERITFDHLVSMKKPNETALVKLLRNGGEHAFTITLQPVSNSFTGLLNIVISTICINLVTWVNESFKEP